MDIRDNYSGLLNKMFKLFGHYGNVSRIRIFTNDRNKALIEYQNLEQAVEAHKHLDKIPFFGCELDVDYSR